MNTDIEQTLEPQTEAPPQRRFSGWQVFGIVCLAMLITGLLTFWIFRTYIFPSEFEPVTLSQKEERVLDNKLARLQGLRLSAPRPAAADAPAEPPLQPEAYSEDAASRQIDFTERELNALLANNTNLASRLAIDLSDNLASAKLLVPMEQDFPILGGKTLKVNAGMELAFRSGRPVVKLRGVSIMGVPIPNAWLGNLKNVDLVSEFGADEGFWKTFAAGVNEISVREGQLHVALKE